jgi:hypothetical protein
MDWPEFTDDHTIRRLAAPSHELPNFGPEFVQLSHALGLISLDTGTSFEERKAHGLGYPWVDEIGDFIIAGDEISPGTEIDDGLDRFPLLAYGSNAVPHRLAIKFRGLEPDPIRICPALLTDFDVIAGVGLTPVGAVAGELAPSPGTTIAVAVVWATAPQLERLTFTEFGYQFGRLEDIRMTIAGEPGPTHAYAYVSRFGGFDVDGELVALEAVPADNRKHKAMTQLEVLGLFAKYLLGEQADADDLLRRLHCGREECMAFLLESFPRLLANAREIEPYAAFTEYSLR